MNVTNKIRNIRKAIHGEGIASYAARIARLGRYRLAIRKFLNKSRLAADHAEVNGHQLGLPNRRSGIVEELLLYGVHEPVATQNYSRALRPGMNILEVGTNLGYYLAIASRQVGPTGCIVGFEPDPELFRIATKNSVGLMAPTKIHPFAASDKNDTARFHQSEVGNWGSLKNDGRLQQTESIDVETRTIDSFCEEIGFRPHALRMDIEGAEAMALSGAKQTIKKHKPILFIEIHKFMLNEAELRSIFSMLAHNGYDKITAIDRYYDWPWCLESARKNAAIEMGIKDFEKYYTSPSSPSVFSIIASVRS